MSRRGPVTPGAGRPWWAAGRCAFSLVEVLLAVVLVAVLITAVTTLARGGARTAAKAGEAQIAALLAGRLVDRLMTNDYRGLRALVGQDVELELARLEDGTGRTLDIDGVAFGARYRVDEESPGLLKITLTVRWQHPAGTPGTFAVTRHVANPALGLIVP